MFLLFGQSMLFSDLSPETYRSKADSNMIVGQNLVKEARSIMNNNSNPQTLKIALSLYVKAGKLFEEASKTYTALGPNYVTMEMVEGSIQAMNSCVKNANKIKQHI